MGKSITSGSWAIPTRSAGLCEICTHHISDLEEKGETTTCEGTRKREELTLPSPPHCQKRTTRLLLRESAAPLLAIRDMFSESGASPERPSMKSCHRSRTNCDRSFSRRVNTRILRPVSRHFSTVDRISWSMPQQARGPRTCTKQCHRMLTMMDVSLLPK